MLTMHDSCSSLRCLTSLTIDLAAQTLHLSFASLAVFLAGLTSLRKLDLHALPHDSRSMLRAVACMKHLCQLQELSIELMEHPPVLHAFFDALHTAGIISSCTKLAILHCPAMHAGNEFERSRETCWLISQLSSLRHLSLCCRSEGLFGGPEQQGAADYAHLAASLSQLTYLRHDCNDGFNVYAAWYSAGSFLQEVLPQLSSLKHLQFGNHIQFSLHGYLSGALVSMLNLQHLSLDVSCMVSEVAQTIGTLTMLTALQLRRHAPLGAMPVQGRSDILHGTCPALMALTNLKLLQIANFKWSYEGDSDTVLPHIEGLQSLSLFADNIYECTVFMCLSDAMLHSISSHAHLTSLVLHGVDEHSIQAAVNCLRKLRWLQRVDVGCKDTFSREEDVAQDREGVHGEVVEAVAGALRGSSLLTHVRLCFSRKVSESSVTSAVTQLSVLPKLRVLNVTTEWGDMSWNNLHADGT